MGDIKDMLSVLDGKKENVGAELNKAAQGVHDLYLAYLSAGFTPRQSMELVSVVIAAGLKK